MLALAGHSAIPKAPRYYSRWTGRAAWNVLNFPGEAIAPYTHVLPLPELGVLEAVTVNAVLAAFDRMVEDADEASKA